MARRGRTYRRRTRRGGGFLNRVKGLFTRKRGTVGPTPVPAAVATAQPRSRYSLPSIKGWFTRKRPVARSAKNIPLNWAERLVPKKDKTQVVSESPSKQIYTQSGIEFTPENIQLLNTNRELYESTQSGTERSIAFAYSQLLPTPIGVNKNSPPVKLTPQQKKELRIRILQSIQQPDGSFQYPDVEEYDSLSQSLFGLSEDEFTRKLILREKQSSEPGKRPYLATSEFKRLFPYLLRTEQETKYKSNQGDLECYPYTENTNVYTELKPNVCIKIANNIYNLYENRVKGLYICVHSKFFPPERGYRYEEKYYNTGIDPKNTKVIGLPYKSFFKASFIQDAFQNGGVWLFHPRLFVLLQESNRDKLEGQYLMPRFDRTDLVTIATLQKYAAIRRYIWTKDTMFSSQVYKDDLRILSAELRSPYITLPGLDTVLPGFSRDYQEYSSEGISENKLQERAYLVPYFQFNVFDTTAFLKEFRDNQLWAGGKVRYSSYSDPRLDSILPMSPLMKRVISASGEVTNPAYTTRILPWLKDETFRAREEVPIPPLAEERELAAHARALGIFGLNNNVSPGPAPIVSPPPTVLTRANTFRRIANRSEGMAPQLRTNLRRMANAINQTNILDEDEIGELERRFNISLQG
jgi:hypothetical protein